MSVALQADVVAAARGDHGAFARLVRATQSTVASISLAILRDAELSTDVAQDVYLAAWTELGKLRDPSSFLPWLRQLTRNRAHHVLRGDIRRRRLVSASHADELLAAAADPRPDAAASLVAREELAALTEAVDALPAASREVVILYYREGESARQVAELLGMSEDAVKQRLSRARSRLRLSLARHLEQTAPAAAFTAAVMTAVSLAAPPAAAAATLAGGAAAGKVAAKAAVLTGGALGGFIAGFLGGVWGVLSGTRELLFLARDDEERRGVRWSGAAQVAAIAVFMAACLLAPRPVPVTLAFAGMIAACGWVHFLWLPRVTRRRHAAELAADPERFAIEQRGRHRRALFGFWAGAFFGSLPIIALWLRG